MLHNFKTKKMLKGILSISGQKGLFKVISQAKNSIIVESLIDGKRFPAYATSRISALEDISIYTIDGEVKLSEVLLTISTALSGSPIDEKMLASDKIKAQFEVYLPNYDKERVYSSDMKKLFSWYNILATSSFSFDPSTEVAETEAKA